MKNSTKINFKKVFIIFLVVVIVAGIASAVTLGVVFKDKITLITEYRTINRQCRSNSMDVKDRLTTFAKSSDDVVDVYVLDSSGNVLFSAKESGLAENDKLDLQSASNDNSFNRYGEHRDQWRHKRNSILYDPAKPDIYYQVINDESRVLLSFVKGFVSETEFDDDDYFESGAFRTFSISYMTDRQTGNKTCFIFDITPVSNAMVYIKIITVIAGLFFMVYWLLVALCVYSDAKKSKLNGNMWGILTLFTNLWGVILYLIYKYAINQKCPECKAVQKRSNAYCVSCGAKLAVACEKCGGIIGRNEAYCKHCGHKN